MVKKSDIQRLLNKNKKIKGEQVGRLLLFTLLDDLKSNKPRVTSKEISDMVDNLSPYEGEVYNTFVSIYGSLVDVYNFIQSCATSATLSITNIRNNLHTLAFNALQQAQRKDSPVPITERQYRRYLTKYNKFIKELSDFNKAKKVTVLQYLEERFSGIIECYDPDDKDYWSVYPHIHEVLEKYEDETIPEEDADFIRKIYKQAHPKGENYFGIEKHTVLNILMTEDCYDDEINKQLKELGSELNAEQLKPIVQREYLNNLYSKHMNKELASEFALSNLGIHLQVFKNWDKHKEEEPQELPNPLKKIDLINNYVISIPYMWHEVKQEMKMPDHNGAPDLEQPAYSKLKKEDIDKLNAILSKEFEDMWVAVVKDTIADFPKMKDLLTINSRDDLSKVYTVNDFVKAGDIDYKQDTSITELKKNSDFGMWNIFPANTRAQARSNGFTVFHGEGSRVDDKFFLDTQNMKDALFINRLNDTFTDANKKELTSAYENINQYLRWYQAYKRYIDGIAYFAKSDELKDFYGIPQQRKFLIEVQNLTDLRNMTLYELDQAIDDKELFKEDADKIRELFPDVDPDANHIEPARTSDIASYLAQTYSGALSKPISTAFILNQVAGGLKNEQTEEE